jgi:hypothetical protein
MELMLVDVFLGLEKVGAAGQFGTEPVGFAGGLNHGEGQHCPLPQFFNLTKKKGCFPPGKHPFCYAAISRF